jgi:hypothetical protein
MNGDFRRQIGVDPSVLVSLLYLVSAGCILWGVGLVLGPIWDKPEIAGEKFACLGSLGLYTLALLGAALLLVLWQQVYDDAVALTVLLFAFLVGSAAAIDVVAPDFAQPALGIGIAGLLLAGVIVEAEQRWLIGRWPVEVVLAVMALLAWNYLMPAVLGLSMGQKRTNLELMPWWLGGWWWVLAVGGVLWWAAGRAGDAKPQARPKAREEMAGEDEAEEAPPFLRSAGMRWLAAILVFAGSLVHQWGLLWAFNLPLRWGDLLPGLVIVTAIVLALQRQLYPGALGRRGSAAVALTPLVMCWWVLVGEVFSFDATWSLGLVSYPPVVMALMAAALAYEAWVRGSKMMTGLAIGYGLHVMLFWGIGVEYPVTLEDLNFWVTAVGLCVLAWMLAWWWNHPTLAGLGAGVAALGLAILSNDAQWLHGYEGAWFEDMSALAVFVMLLGLGNLIVYTCWHRCLPMRLGVLTSAVFALGVLWCCAPIPENLVLATIWATVALMLIGTAAWISRNALMLVPAVAPLVIVGVLSSRQAWRMMLDAVDRNRGWSLVLLSFVLLAAGLAASLWRAGRRRLD